VSEPSQAPFVPPEVCVGMRCVGALTHRKLELPFHGSGREAGR
jgi:hypothetical protein